MFNFSKPLLSFKSQRENRQPLRLWVCEYEITGTISPSNGVFVIEAGHFLDARQISKKVLRDELARGVDFKFQVRQASLLERAQLKVAPAQVETKIPPHGIVPSNHNFADDPP